VKLLGAAMILLGGGWAAAGEVRRKRREQAMLGELAAALRDMAAAIRWRKEPLPRVIRRQCARPLCGETFSAVLNKMESNCTLQDAWEEVFSEFTPKEAGACLRQAIPRGDEAHLLGALHLAQEQLERMRQERRERQREEERLRLALAFSGMGLLVILLI
jgi:hypothetical protein